MMTQNMMTQNIDIGKEKLYISTDLDARRASLTLLSPRVKNIAGSSVLVIQVPNPGDTDSQVHWVKIQS